MVMKRNAIKGLLETISVIALLLLSAAFVPAQQGWVILQSSAVEKDLNAVHFSDSRRGWVAGDDGFVSRTIDGGLTWNQQIVETKDAINDIYFRNKEDGYLLAGSSIFQTEDGGQTWTEIRRYFASDFGGAVAELYSVRFSGKKRGWVVGSI